MHRKKPLPPHENSGRWNREPSHKPRPTPRLQMPDPTARRSAGPTEASPAGSLASRHDPREAFFRRIADTLEEATFDQSPDIDGFDQASDIEGFDQSLDLVDLGVAILVARERRRGS